MRDLFVWRPRRWTRGFTINDDTPPTSLWTLDPSRLDERYDWIDVAGAGTARMRCHAITLSHATRCPKDGVLLLRVAVDEGAIVDVDLCGGHFGMLARGRAVLVTQHGRPSAHTVDRARI